MSSARDAVVGLVPGPADGTCALCLNSRPVYPVTRTSAGPHRRRGATYRSTICAWCAIGLVSRAGGESGDYVRRFSVLGLARIVRSLDTREARAALVDYTHGRAAQQMLAEARMAAWEAQRAARGA